MEPRHLHFTCIPGNFDVSGISPGKAVRETSAWLLSRPSGAFQLRCILQQRLTGLTPLLTSLGFCSPSVVSKVQCGRVWPRKKWKHNFKWNITKWKQVRAGWSEKWGVGQRKEPQVEAPGDGW